MRRLMCALFVLLLLPVLFCAAQAETEKKEVFMTAFDTVDLEGNPVDLSLMDGASFILLNIWEPWCGPCKSEMPDMSELYLKYRDRGLLIVGVSGMTSDFPVESAAVAEELQVAYPLVQWQEGLIPFTIEAFPTSFLYLRKEDGSLKAEGYMVGMLTGEQWEDLFLQYLPDPADPA